VVVLVLLAVVAGLIGWLWLTGRPAELTAAERSSVITAELTQRMRTVLEGLPPEQHQGHGGNAASGSVSTVCGTRVYGYEPATAATTADVVTVYGFHLCGLVEPGRTWDWAMKLVGPLVMRLDQGPPTVQMAEATVAISYRDRVKQLIPVRYQKLALEEALGPDAMAELRRRYDAAVGL